MRDAIDRTNQAWLAAYAAYDSAKLAALYAPDASVFSPGAARADGRDAIRKFWQGAMDSGATNVTIRTIDVSGSSNLAAGTGE